MKERWAGEWGVKMRAMMKTPEFREKVSKGVSRRSREPFNNSLEHISTSPLVESTSRRLHLSRALVDVSTYLEHMDVRAGLKDHHASPAGAVTREKQFKGQRDAKKKAYAADEPARDARAETRAAEEQTRAEARAAENKALAEARADTTEQALADACVEIKFRTPHAHNLLTGRFPHRSR